MKMRVFCVLPLLLFSTTPALADQTPPSVQMSEIAKAGMAADVCTSIHNDEAAIKAAAGQDGKVWWPQLWAYYRTNDYSMHCRYQQANAADVEKGAVDVVMMGDSITEGWQGGDPAFFRLGIVNRGIGGQTSQQMLTRFYPDVVRLKPKLVHIMAGTNDIAGNTGPNELAQYKDNITAMVDIAKANGIRVILGSVPPTNRMAWKPEVTPAPWVAQMNAWLRDFAHQRNIQYVDYHTMLVGAEGALNPQYGSDGVHPDAKGYAVMRPLAQAAIESELYAK
jgi:lysophospholipase L1-like esterase